MILRAALIAAAAALGGCESAGIPLAQRPDPASAFEAAADPLAPAYVATEDDPALAAEPAAEGKGPRRPEPRPGAADADESATGPLATEASETAPETAPETEAARAEPDPNAAARAACEQRKGVFTRTRAGAFVCVTRTRDSGKACTASGQCQGQCLARSGTCAPVTPLVGCHEIFTGAGGRATVCID